MLNSGIPDSGLLVHLSEATAGSLNGVGHSTAYEEVATYSYVSLFSILAFLPTILFAGRVCVCMCVFWKQLGCQVSFPYE